uniref:thioesterase II family protein n=1 Tax=Herbidospora sakaeratensis TaxID=564415 RepID=UPI000A5254F4|nr:alpha/beta fold hydrolase [Herbidospora sakaeratensis]
MTSAMTSGAWAVRLGDRPAPVRLFCFPYAGGGAAVFRRWPAALPGVEVYAIRLPGRENRFCEPLLTSHDGLPERLADALRPLLDRPYALFGHSLGALLAYETARLLRPAHLFVGGSRAPHLPRPATAPDVAGLDDAAFTAMVREMGGTPPEFFGSAELAELLLPVLRADFGLAEAYRHRPGPPLEAPITALRGADEDVTPAMARAWAPHTAAGFALHEFPGGHFFLQDGWERVCRLVAQNLPAATPLRSAGSPDRIAW